MAPLATLDAAGRWFGPANGNLKRSAIWNIARSSQCCADEHAGCTVFGEQQVEVAELNHMVSLSCSTISSAKQATLSDRLERMAHA